MPTVLRIGSFRFHFYSDERNEPVHIHVATPDGEAKFWLQPIRLAANRSLKRTTIRKIKTLLFQHQPMLVEKYHAFHAEN